LLALSWRATSFIAVSLLLALSLVNQPISNKAIIIDTYLQKLRLAYLFPQTITVNGLHNCIADVGTKMAAWQWSESKLLGMQLPGDACTMDKMPRDGQVRVADLRCPGIKGE
jgi:hypothetical protein